MSESSEPAGSESENPPAVTSPRFGIFDRFHESSSTRMPHPSMLERGRGHGRSAGGRGRLENSSMNSFDDEAIVEDEDEEVKGAFRSVVAAQVPATEQEHQKRLQVHQSKSSFDSMSRSIFAIDDDDLNDDVLDSVSAIPAKKPKIEIEKNEKKSPVINKENNVVKDDDDDDGLFEEDDTDLLEVASTSQEVKKEVEPAADLTISQKARMERNRLKALSLKQARLQMRPESSKDKRDGVTGEKIVKVQEKKVVDSGAGFFIDEEDDAAENDPANYKELPAPILKPDQPLCLECEKDFPDSYLYRTFNLSVCDNCKDTERDGKHELITKTDAKNTFLLKDGDFDRREPVLKFIVRKNPHNSRWGDMKLYLRSQVEERALEVWGSEEALEKHHEEREDKKEKAKVKKFNKQIKALRMQVRGSLFKKDLSTHTHEFGEEGYDEEEDEYFKTCKTCDFTQRYEKM